MAKFKVYTCKRVFFTLEVEAFNAEYAESLARDMAEEMDINEIEWEDEDVETNPYGDGISEGEFDWFNEIDKEALKNYLLENDVLDEFEIMLCYNGIYNRDGFDDDVREKIEDAMDEFAYQNDLSQDSIDAAKKDVQLIFEETFTSVSQVMPH